MLSDCHAQRRLMVLPPGPSGLERHAGAPADPQQLMLKRPHRIKFNLMVSAVCEPRSASRASAINRNVDRVFDPSRKDTINGQLGEAV